MSNTLMNDFTRMADAKSYALALMDAGVQFSFCVHPLSISHPAKRAEIPADQAVPAEPASPLVG